MQVFILRHISFAFKNADVTFWLLFTPLLLFTFSLFSLKEQLINPSKGIFSFSHSRTQKRFHIPHLTLPFLSFCFLAHFHPDPVCIHSFISFLSSTLLAFISRPSFPSAFHQFTFSRSLQKYTHIHTHSHNMDTNARRPLREVVEQVAEVYPESYTPPSASDNTASASESGSRLSLDSRVIALGPQDVDTIPASRPNMDPSPSPSSLETSPGPGTSSTSTTSPESFVQMVGDRAVRSDIPLSVLQQLYLPDKANAYRKINAEDQTLSFPHSPSYPSVKMLSNQERKRILVTGGAGFVGSHLVDRLMLMGHEVIVLDNFFTGSKRNVQHWLGHPHFEMIRHDVVDPFMIEVDQIYHLACPASPPHYQYNPIKTVKTSVMGTINMLGLAKRTKARFLLTSTSGTYLCLFYFKTHCL